MRTLTSGRRVGLRFVLLFSQYMISHAAGPLEDLKTFTSTAGRYVVEYPSNWHVVLRSLPTLYIENLPPAQHVRAVLPKGGVSISVVPPRAGILDAEQWAARDLKPRMTRLSKSSFVLKSRTTGGSLDITEVVLAWGLPGAEYERVDCYFTVSGRLYAGRLTYWKGDARAPEYRQTLHAVIESLKPLDVQ